MLGTKEQIGILLFLVGSILAIVVGAVLFLLTGDMPLLSRMRTLALLWMLLGIAGVYLSNRYLERRNDSSLRWLFYIALLNLLTASSYFFTALMCFIGAYFIYEDKVKKRTRIKKR